MIRHSSPSLDSGEVNGVREILDGGQIGPGPKVAEFEKAFAGFMKAEDCFATTSATAGEHLALLAMGVGKDDEVILPSFTCPSLLFPLAYVGARPILVDVEENGFNLDPREVRKKVTSRTKAILVPHMYGFPADVGSLSELGIPIIEDCTQALGASREGRMVGSIGDVAIASLYATKLLTTGTGGIISSNNRKLNREIRELGDHYLKGDYRVRYPYHLNDLQAAIGLVQLGKFPRFIERRRELARCYTEELEGLGLALPVPNCECEPVFFRYVARTSRRDELLLQLQRKGIAASAETVSLHACLADVGTRFPQTRRILAENLSLPLYPSLSDGQAGQVIEAVKESVVRNLGGKA